jgi:hypothetical protein
MRRNLLRSADSIRQKQKGDFSFEISPFAIRFSKIWFGTQITASRHFRIVRSLRAEPALPVPFRHSIRCKSFLVPSAAASCLSAA